MNICITAGCGKKQRGVGLCAPHYYQMRAETKKRGGATTDLIDVTEAREHIKQLHEHGLSYEQIATMSGVRRSTISRITQGAQRRISERHAISIRRIKPGTIPSNPSALVTALGAQRRIQAMHALGWPMHMIVRDLGFGQVTIGGIAHGRQSHVTAERHRLIADWYRKVHMTPGPSDRARRLAQKYGWSVPLQWNDGEIDNPKARPSNYSWARYQGTDRVVAA
ncbi:helix-turn-helix transcriptional regulator [Rhodococcus qingshengii]|uniref:Helix-turn-helix transcriptional regulator n=1 Tax=Rhodococcus qingshengii TaxID=334542 RepID=A0AAW6LSD2_RHOSG|nr:helix-turn-helix transcriptional regulator [Rhodococcus qingshengii]MDE8648157.1 helix-turn-helix transcriptional regulator [Rhodococcus qingshengii]